MKTILLILSMLFYHNTSDLPDYFLRNIPMYQKSYQSVSEMKKVIKYWEKLRLKKYILFGKTYIGYGHLTKSLEKITEYQADSILDSDFSQNYNAICILAPNAHEKHRLLLTLLAFNIGIGKVSKSNLLKLVKINSSDFEIYLEYLKFTFINEKYSEKLEARRSHEIELFN